MKLRLVLFVVVSLLLLHWFMMQLLGLRGAEFGLIMLAGSPTSNFLSQSTLQYEVPRPFVQPSALGILFDVDNEAGGHSTSEFTPKESDSRSGRPPQ